MYLEKTFLFYNVEMFQIKKKKNNVKNSEKK